MHIDPIMASSAVSLSPDLRRNSTDLKKPSQPEEPIVAEVQIEQVVSETNHALEPFQMSLQFTKDEDTGMIVVKVVDKAGETVRQTPTEASLVIAAGLSRLQGKIFSGKA